MIKIIILCLFLTGCNTAVSSAIHDGSDDYIYESNSVED